MVLLLSFLLLGILVGAFPGTPQRFYNFSTKILNIGLFGLLFFMGVRLGTYPNILKQVKIIGSVAFLFACFTLVGSVVVVWIIEKILSRNSRKAANK